MDREDFIAALRRCLKKAFLDVTWSFSTDEDEDAKLCLDRDGFLIFCFVRTPYQASGVLRVKYGIDEAAGDYYVVLDMKDGSRLRIGEARGEAYILLQTGTTEDVCLYRSGAAR